MVDPGPRQRARQNATGIASTVVTGIWLAAMLAGFEYWLPMLLIGYIVVVPLVALLFGDEEDIEEWWDEDVEMDDEQRDSAKDHADSDDTALAALRERYARGELTDEQFERKVERLLETDTLENVEDRERERATEFE